MNPKEKKLVDDLCGENGGFYTEDFYEIEVVDETAVKKLVNYISNVHQFRPSDKAIRIYKLFLNVIFFRTQPFLGCLKNKSKKII